MAGGGKNWGEMWCEKTTGEGDYKGRSGGGAGVCGGSGSGFVHGRYYIGGFGVVKGIGFFFGG